MLPAPGRLSTTTVWLNTCPSRSPTTRAAKSVEPPAPCGTTIRIGRSGYSAAEATPVSAEPIATTTPSSASRDSALGIHVDVPRIASVFDAREIEYLSGGIAELALARRPRLRAVPE